jgi:hypothetical protein
MIYHKKDNQITCRATITPNTPAALAAIIAAAGIDDLAAHLADHARAPVCTPPWVGHIAMRSSS